LILWKDIGLDEPLDSARFEAVLKEAGLSGLIVIDGSTWPSKPGKLFILKENIQSPIHFPKRPVLEELEFRPARLIVSSADPCSGIIQLDSFGLWTDLLHEFIPMDSRFAFSTERPVRFLGMDIIGGSARVEPRGLLFSAGTTFFSK
jgi:hypothetical protein